MDIIFYIKDSNLNYLIASDSFLKNLKLNGNYKVVGKNDSDFFPEREAKINNKEDKEILNSFNASIYKEGLIPGSRKKNGV